MKTLALIIMLLMGAQPAIFAAASVCAPSSCSMSCCKGKSVCCCHHHDKGVAGHNAAKSDKSAPMPGCSLGCSNPADNFIAPSNKSLTSALDFTLFPVVTENFGRAQDFTGSITHTTSPPLVSSAAFPLPLRI